MTTTFKDILPDNFKNKNINYKKFIDKKLEDWGKIKENELIKTLNELSKSRIKHIVSTVFIGIYIYDNCAIIRHEVDSELKKISLTRTEYEGNYKFIFIWYLACLFHDLGYAIENKEGTVAKNESLQKYFETNKCKDLLPPNGVPDFYQNVYESYFNYRIKNHGKIDHGIYAAFIAFRDLCKIREKKEKEFEDNNPDNYWDISLESVYNFVSWIILAHNIWFANEENKNEQSQYYEENGLNELILKKGEYKISLSEHPFLFLFCLVDAIEPIKKVKDIKLLDKTSLTINKEKITIKSNVECGCGDLILNNVKSLNNWLTKTEFNEKEKTVDIFLTKK